MTTTTIVVTPWGEDGFHVNINGENSANFTAGGQAAVEWALLVLKVRKLEEIIDNHASWLHSRTQEEIGKLDQWTVMEMAQELREKAGIV